MLYEIVHDFPNDFLKADAEICISLYQPTHRHGPENQQDPIRFKNLVREIEESLLKTQSKQDAALFLKPFEALVTDREFWQHAGDGIAVFATKDKCVVYKLAREVKELAIVANSFHITPLIRVFQSADRYHLLGINGNEFSLFEGDRYGFEKVEIDPEIPQTIKDTLGDQYTEAHFAAGSAGGHAGSAVFQGHGSRKDEISTDLERFFKHIDRVIIDNYSHTMRLPVILVALAEYHAPFQNISHNKFLLNKGIPTAYDALTIDELKESAWKKIEPLYLEKTKNLVDNFENARAKDEGSDDIVQVAKAAIENRISRILLESDRIIPGKIDRETGALIEGDLQNPKVNDILDDLAELVFKNQGEVVVLPKERMPSITGVAATYRY